MEIQFQKPSKKLRSSISIYTQNFTNTIVSTLDKIASYRLHLIMKTKSLKIKPNIRGYV